MKKAYTKPELDTKAYAQFENVFTACNKGNDGPAGCIFVDDPDWPPKKSDWAAFKQNSSIPS
ncbi:hypothetical protein [Dehalobacter sp. UNSWDHB]|uniref:hypothetical protein n=1 Tax=Dehalobacter sp. UNSWDHB TaxID=1339256 RepID=UPI000553AA3D|nr:hypothetical protein [Dehalobacter sp. UNSWDHB]